MKVQSGDELVLLYVVPKEGPSVSLASTSLSSSLGVDSDFRTIESYMSAEKTAEDSVDKMKAYEEMIATNKPGVKVARLAKIGEPGKEIVHASEELKADQIVIGSRGLNAISNVSDYVVKHANCSVTIVKPKH